MKKSIFVVILLLFISVPILSQTTDCIKWVEASNGDIPRNAVVGRDEDGAKLYIARVFYKGGTHPGKIRKGWDGCNISYGGKEITLRNYEVLVYNRNDNRDDDKNDVVKTLKHFFGKDLSVETLKVKDSFDDDWKKGLFLKDEESNSLIDKLAKLQRMALEENCDVLADKIDDLRNYLGRSMPSRNEVKNRLDNIYDSSKDCD